MPRSLEPHHARLVAPFVVGSGLVALFGVGAFASALGLVLLHAELREARRVALASVLAVCALGYAFVLEVGVRGGFLLWAVVAYMACLALAALPPLIASTLTWRLARTLEARALVLPLTWALCTELVPTVFPFRPSYLALPSLPLAQWLSVGGPVLLDALVIGLGTSTVVLLRCSGRTRVIAALFIALVVGGGFVMLAAARDARRPSLDVGVVSPAISLEEARSPRTRAARLARLHALGERVRDASFVVWPESTYPHRILPDATRDAPSPGGVRRGAGPPVLAGASVGEDGCEPFSSLVAVGEEGALLGRVDKARRMPFGDVVPLRALPFVSERFPCGTREGERFAPLSLASTRVGGLVCYDEIVPSVARARVLAGAALLVSGSNDAWYAGTFEPSLHERVARARAIETRRDLVRAVNMGEGGLVASTGELLVSLPGTRPEARVVRVAPSDARTPFVRLGDGSTLLVALALALLVVASRVSRARRAAESPTS